MQTATATESYRPSDARDALHRAYCDDRNPFDVADELNVSLDCVNDELHKWTQEIGPHVDYAWTHVTTA